MSSLVNIQMKARNLLILLTSNTTLTVISAAKKTEFLFRGRKNLSHSNLYTLYTSQVMQSLEFPPMRATPLKMLHLLDPILSIKLNGDPVP